jgi:flavodoxin
MNTLVIYDSQFGNTERVAQAIAEALHADGIAQALRFDPARPVELQGLDLLVVGSPTQGWRPTPAIQSWLASLTAEQLRGVGVACFDTRFKKPRWLTGSAAQVIARRLRKHGAALFAPPESFFVQSTQGPLVDGELQRAASWAQALINAPAMSQLTLR